MLEKRKYLQIGKFFFILFFLCCFTLFRMVSVYCVSHNDIKCSFLKKMAEGVTIQATNNDSIWVKKYPFDTRLLSDLEYNIMDKKKTLHAYCVGGFPGAEEINDVLAFLEYKILNFSIEVDSKEYGDAAYVSEAVTNMESLSKFCCSTNIPFAFFLTPCPDNVFYYSGEFDKINNWTVINRSHALVDGVIGAGINTTVVAERAIYDNHGISFDSSIHWYSRDALYTAKLIAKELNQEYGFNVDINAFNSDDFTDVFDKYPDVKNTIKTNMGYDYEFLVPSYSCNYVMTYAEGGTTYKGDFEETFIRSVEDWELNGGAYHGVSNIGNSLIFDIYNKSDIDCKKKLLIIGDSFNWPVAMYLSLGIKEVSIIHNASFTGSIEAYIKTNDPDAVLVVYNDAEFYDIYTEDAFDLR